MARAEYLGHVYPTLGTSLEDICGLVALTELCISGETDPVVELLHNISALTKLKVLQLDLNVKTLPAEMPHWFIQLQQLEIWGHKKFGISSKVLHMSWCFSSSYKFSTMCSKAC